MGKVDGGIEKDRLVDVQSHHLAFLKKRRSLSHIQLKLELEDLNDSKITEFHKENEIEGQLETRHHTDPFCNTWRTITAAFG